MNWCRALIVIASFIICAPAQSAEPKHPQNKSKKPQKHGQKLKDEPVPEFNLSTASFKEILDRYVFIADFNQKPAERPISREFLWKYPFKLPPVQFALDIENINLNEMVYRYPGSGRKVEVFNAGRVAFLDGDHKKAHSIWLAGRQEFKDDVASNRVFEFFLGVNAVAGYRQKLDQFKNDPENSELKAYLQATAYFFASAFILRRDVTNELVDRHAPWALYNLAVIYYKFDRIPSVYGAAEEGLGVLLRQGKKLHRADFRQLLAETHIRNQDLISAIQELDTAIRQDPDPMQAARMFYRAADIYYDLNNYELAEDLYAMASAIDKEQRIVNPAELLLRAESVFWLGRFDEAERLFRIATDYAIRGKGNEWLHSSGTLPWAWLRIADCALAKSAVAKDKEQKDLLAKTRLAYFKVELEYPKTEATRIANVRAACLELPQYEGNNVKHAREFLGDVKTKNDVPQVLMELVWACDAGSYSQREKTDEMVAKIKEFTDKYPQSKFAVDMLPPVRDVQASKINEYFAKKQWESATEFFEQKRQVLFPKVSEELADKLWIAYVSTNRSEQAIEFWKHANHKYESDMEALRKAAFLYEASSQKSQSSLLKERAVLDKEFSLRKWSKKPTKEEVGYLSRILASSSAPSAYLWVLKIQEAWSDGEDGAECDAMFPLFSRVSSDKKSTSSAKREVYVRTKDFVSKDLKSIQAKDATCFQSWLDLEAKILSQKDLEMVYGGRKDWPLIEPWLEKLWSWSEKLNAQGRRNDAIEIWKILAEGAPKESFENRMAKTRLDPNKTEFESLWK